ncbi:MAG: alanine racemase [Bacteriovoracaceae bacterium]|jgi:alanine racemase|nr:alanine racemase [Bacteriovoracaceae bacterium]
MRYESKLHVNFDFLRENLTKVKSRCSSSELIFMVKANAYGHGIVPITSFSHSELGVRNFGLASLGEANLLRSEIKSTDFNLYVFSDLNLGISRHAELYAQRKIIPVISNLIDLKIFLETPIFKSLPLVLKFNTGMNRIGFSVTDLEEVFKLIRLSSRSSIHHLMTHLGCANLKFKENGTTSRQLENFNIIKDYFKSKLISVERTSISNSAAIEQGIGLEESHVRPGLMMYGPKSTMENVTVSNPWDGKIISSLKTKIIGLRAVKKGTPIGYGANPCPRDGQLAIIALGYGDGLSTYYSGAKISHHGDSGQIIGRVNMDMAQVLFPPSMEKKLRVGDEISVWDHSSSQVGELCKHLKTIPYELFCQVSVRVPRVYSGQRCIT